MLQAFNVDASSSKTNVTLTNDSTKLTCQVSLRNLTITGVPAGTPALMLDSRHGSEMQTNALGGTFSGYVTSAVVGHYTQTPEELETKFLDLDMIATEYYRVDIDGGSVLDFSTLKDDRRRQLPGHRRQRDLAGRPHLRQLPQPRALVHDDPQALHAMASRVARRSVSKVRRWRTPRSIPSIEDMGRCHMVRKLIRFGFAGFVLVGISRPHRSCGLTTTRRAARPTRRRPMRRRTRQAPSRRPGATRPRTGATRTRTRQDAGTRPRRRRATQPRTPPRRAASSTKDAAKKAGEKGSDSPGHARARSARLTRRAIAERRQAAHRGASRGSC